MAYSPETTFRDSLEIGKAGEALVQKHLRHNGLTVCDLSGNENWQSVDVDMLVRYPNGSELLSEVKTDTECWETGNILLELRMMRHRSGQVAAGWYSTSVMDVLYYLCAGTGRLFAIDFAKLKELVHNGLGRFTRFTNPIDPDCTGEGILISIDELTDSSALLSCEIIDTSPLWGYDWRHGKPAPF